MTQSSGARHDTVSDRESGDQGHTRLAATVLGMHRSGTSATARILSLLGADLPRHLMEGREDNPTGHWEAERIADLNDEVLGSASSAWDDVSPFPSHWYGSPPEHQLRARAVQLLGDEYGESPFFVLKDPRISRIVPFWVAALDEFRATPCFVIPIRNPLEVAASLRERDQFSTAKGLLLWLRHTLDAERDTRGHPRVFVSYERLLADWEAEANKIADRLEISWPRLSHDTRNQVEQFLSARHHHQRFSTAELDRHTAVVGWVKRCYDAMQEACDTGGTPPADVLAEVAEQLHDADRAYGPVLAAAEGLATRRGAEIESLTLEINARRLRAELAQRELLRRERTLHAHRRQIARLEREAGRRGKLQKARRRLAELEQQLETTGKAEAALRAELADREAVLADRKGDLEGSRSRLERQDGELTELRSELERRGAELEAAKLELSERVAELGRLESRAAASKAGREQAIQTNNELREELAKSREARTEGENRAAKLRSELEVRDARLAERRKEIERLSREVGSRSGELEQAARELSGLDETLARLGAELEALGRRSASERDETALTYLQARPPGRLRTTLRLWGWTLRPGKFASARSFRRIRRSGLFDERFYLVRYPDAATSGLHPIAHYVERGAEEGKDPNPEFSTDAYLASHPELGVSNENPFVNFLRGAPGSGASAGELDGG